MVLIYLFDDILNPLSLHKINKNQTLSWIYSVVEDHFVCRNVDILMYINYVIVGVPRTRII